MHTSAQPAAHAPPAPPIQPPVGSTVHARVVLGCMAYSCIALDGTQGMEMRFVKDVGGLFPEGLRARWMGHKAATFFNAHQAELRPGRALDVALYHIRSRDNETRAYIAAIQLAPLAPSWVKHLEKVNNLENPA